ncbi:ABC transporter substrate-binding protein [Schaalia sp. 19OD2882]|uniref:ABC transporter substrate-binding protein n=1 Tax=Schaalia sp. 19OD2882 TaxID=2794089 RepID=UPI0020A76215|nr:ABC transporter substrate-binding protein [Schaalia sp. 19OD2882]
MSDTLVRMHLEYVHPWPNHAGLFVARKEGFYAEEGLDVDLVSDGDDRGDAAAKLARGEYDLASVRLGQVVESRGTDTPLISIGTFNQRQLGAVMTTPDTGIRRFADLEGRRVAIPPVGRLVQELREAVLADGADPDRVIIEHPEWEVDIRAVEQGL